MLIRSQDKTKLVDIAGKTLAISEATTHDIRIMYANSNVLLGKYTSKEKALKVLDLIGQAYNNFETGFICIVFQMPKDEEVNEVYNKEYLEDINEK